MPSRDLIYDLSRKKLKEAIDRGVAHLDSKLEPSARCFLTVARMQGFDALPERVTASRMEQLIAKGYTELNRGLHSTAEHPAKFYLRELGVGKLYPGSQTAHGHGVYFAEPSRDLPESGPRNIFPRFSEVAEKYAHGQLGGILFRAALRPDAKTVSQDQLFEMYEGAGNRADYVGIKDFGSFAAASGIDAFYIDGSFTYAKERMWVVVNRAKLAVQNEFVTFHGATEAFDKAVGAAKFDLTA